MNKGLFLTFEGIDGSGKTLLATKLVSWLNMRHQLVDYVTSRGYEPIAGITDELLKDSFAYDHYAHLFLSFANNRLLVRTIIEPALKAGKVVVLERYYHSSIAYSVPHGIPFEWMVNLASSLIEPDKVIYCDTAVVSALSRKQNAIEAVETGFRPSEDSSVSFQSYQSEVKRSYDQLIANCPDKFIVLPGEKSAEELFEVLLKRLEGILPS